MKRVVSRLPEVLGYLLAAWGAWLVLGIYLEAVRSQVRYGYAVNRAGRPYNLWIGPVGFTSACLLAITFVAVQDYLAGRRAGQDEDSGITYSESPQRPRRRRKRRR